MGYCPFPALGRNLRTVSRQVGPGERQEAQARRAAKRDACDGTTVRAAAHATWV